MGSLYEDTTSALLKPMMRDLFVNGLTPERQGLIGRWVIKTTLLSVIRDALSKRADYEVERNALFEMNERETVPDGFSVRLARFLADDDPTNRPAESLRGSLQGMKQIRWFGYPALGNLAIEVVSGDVDSALDFIERTDNDDRFVRVWPTSLGTIDYAPLTLLTKADLDAMRIEMFGHSPGNGFFRYFFAPDN